MLDNQPWFVLGIVFMTVVLPLFMVMHYSTKWKATMPVINPGEVWMTDFGMAAKVRPALLLTGSPADDELDVVTVLLHTTALRGNRWELSIPKRK